jgi:alcohol dehydrogenase (NADP+)
MVKYAHSFLVIATKMPSIMALLRRSSPVLRTLHNMKQSRNMATRATSFPLNTGARIPAIGFGTFQDPDAQVEGVSKSLKTGYRLIDTARVYDVEKQVGEGIRKSGVPREEIFIGTKLWCSDFHPDDVERALDDSLRDLQMEYVDLFMLHYPVTFKRGDEKFPRDANDKMILGETTFVDTWKAMEKVMKTGKARAIGVSNFSRGEIERLLNECTVVSCPEHSHLAK